MSDAHAPAADDAKPPKSKKMLIIIIAAVAVLGGGGGWFLMKPKHAAEGEDEPAHAAAAAPHGAPPAFLPLDSLVVNLADPGGDRFAQIGITLEIADAHMADTVKGFMPIIRSGILMVVSQRTTTELLGVEGKEKLAKDIKREVERPLGIESDDDEEAVDEKPAPKKGGKKAKKRHVESPIRQVLFSSFIVQ